MIGAVLCGICFGLVFWGTRRSLGLGISMVLAIGYSYGVIRARFPDGGTHFTFDCGAIALYLAHFTGAQDPERASRSRFVQPWALALTLWPVVCMMVAAALPETQPLLVQLVGLRAAAMYVPFIVLGARLRREDLDRIALALAILNVMALGVGMYEYAFGVESIMPRNRMTDIIYASKDVLAEGERHYRIPGPFQNAHAFGLATASSIPFVMHNLEGKAPARRVMAWVGVGAAALSVFLCGARTPAVLLVATTAYVLVTLRARWGTLLAVAICTAAVAYVVTHVGRFQRFETLADTDMVEGRIAQSVNVSLFDAIGEYPLGAGLASAFGTSVPFFLQDIARPPIGIESEFGRILVEQGLIGLTFWVVFIVLCLGRKAAVRETSNVALTFGHATIAFTWLTAMLGGGFLAAIPHAAIAFLLSGMRLALPPVVAAKHSVRHVATRPERKPLKAGLATARRGLSAPISRTASPS